MSLNRQEGCDYNLMGGSFKRYEGAAGHIVQTRTIFDLAGTVSAKSILDLACGYGFFGRKMLEMGAAKVTGVDISEKMLALALEETKAYKNSADYYLRNVSEMEVLGAYDIAIAAFLFNYAASLQELKAMFKAVASNLKTGGKLIAYTVEPDYDLSKGNFGHYGVTIVDEEPWQEGYRMQAEFASDIPSRFTFYRWSRKDYEEAIAQAGFSSFSWEKPHLLPSDYQDHPEGFWDIYRDNCFHTALVCLH